MWFIQFRPSTDSGVKSDPGTGLPAGLFGSTECVCRVFLDQNWTFAQPRTIFRAELSDWIYHYCWMAGKGTDGNVHKQSFRFRSA